MNDEDLKKEIEDALAVEPSPQFVARVHGRIASEARRTWMGLPWVVPAAGLAAAGVIAAVIVLQPRETTHPKKAVETAERALPPRIETPLAQTEVRPRLPAATRQAGPKPRHTEPEVLFDPRETAAFRSFLEDVQEQKIDPARLKGLLEAAEKARAVEDIAPRPIAAIEPIDVPPLSSSVPVKEEGGSL